MEHSVMVLLGAKKLRVVGSDLGQAVRGLTKELNDGVDPQSELPERIRFED